MAERRKKGLSSKREVEEVEVNTEVSPQGNPKGGKVLNPGRPHLHFGGVGGKFFLTLDIQAVTCHQYGMLKKRLEIHI